MQLDVCDYAIAVLMASRDNLSPSLKLCSSSNPPKDAGKKTSRQERRREERRKRKFKCT